jgi:hypothetical protein
MILVITKFTSFKTYILDNLYKYKNTGQTRWNLPVHNDMKAPGRLFPENVYISPLKTGWGSTLLKPLQHL